MSDLDTVFEDQLPEDHRSGVIAVVGRPNVGKSTLINRILGQKIAAVSPKPQTTRRRQLGIYTTDKAQILFVDTPGLHAPQHKLGEYMVKNAEGAFRDADLILLLYSSNPAVNEPITSSPIWSNLRAVRAGQVVEIDGATWYVQSVRSLFHVIDALEEHLVGTEIDTSVLE